MRQRVFSRYFGLSDAADAFNAAFRIPNFLQNLFGEGVLSASFIPVYARLLAEGDEEEAGRVAGAVAAILALITSRAGAAGSAGHALLIDAIAPGFHGAKRELTIRLVRVLFPGAGLLVISAWCLGILNSHRKFFLSYTAPVIWNAAMIAALMVFRRMRAELAGRRRWHGVRWPAARCSSAFNCRWCCGWRATLRAPAGHAPRAGARGGPQFRARCSSAAAWCRSAPTWTRCWRACWATGAVAGLTNAQTLYTLPVSLFGMAVSAAELPAMSSALGDASGGGRAICASGLNAGLRRIAFFIVPSAMAFLALGGVIAAALFQNGLFNHADSTYVWGILAGSAVGLLASTLGRLYSSTYYALRDTRTPLRFAVIRVSLTTALGYLCALPLPRWLGLEPRWGVAGLTASAGVAGWVEFTLLRRTLERAHRRAPACPPPGGEAVDSAAAGGGGGLGRQTGHRSGVTQ